VEYSLTDGMGEMLEALRIMQYNGGHGTQFNENGIPVYSLPFTVEDAPQGTVSIAIVLEDKDAYPVTGDLHGYTGWRQT